MKILGITGSSGSGKTTLSNILRKRTDTVILDADKIARELNRPGTEYMASIEDTFGKDILLEDGNLNRRGLAKLIYSNDDARKKLNDLTFKYVVNEINKRIDIIKNTNKNVKYIIIDAPLLFEAGIDSNCDIVISLIADKNLKIKRICKRDNIGEEDAKNRLDIQHENRYYIEKSDYIIENTEDYNLEKEINRIMKEIEEKA